MGLMDSIGNFFGGGSSKSETTQQAAWNPQQQALFQQLYGIANQNLGKPTPSYPGQMYVNTQPSEQSYFNYMGGTGTMGQAREQAYQGLISGKPAYEINPETTQKAWDLMANSLSQDYQKYVLPLVQEQYAGPGYHSGGFNTGREGGILRSTSDFANNLANKHAELIMNDETARRAALESAAGRQQGAATAYGTELGTAGQYARAIEQEKVMGDLQRWLMGESVNGVSDPSRNAFMQYALNMLGLNPYAYSTNQTSTGPGLGYSVISGLAQGFGNMVGGSYGKTPTKTA